MKKPELITLEEFEKLSTDEQTLYLLHTAPAKFKPYLINGKYRIIVFIILPCLTFWFNIAGISLIGMVLIILADIFYNKWYCDKYHLEYNIQINKMWKKVI